MRCLRWQWDRWQTNRWLARLPFDPIYCWTPELSGMGLHNKRCFAVAMRRHQEMVARFERNR